MRRATDSPSGLRPDTHEVHTEVEEGPPTGGLGGRAKRVQGIVPAEGLGVPPNSFLSPPKSGGSRGLKLWAQQPRRSDRDGLLSVTAFSAIIRGCWGIV